MTAVLPKLESGSIVDAYRPIWAGYYSAVEKIIGNGGIIIPLLDPDHVASSTTMTTRTHHTDGPSAEITGTWSEAPTAFDTPADLSDIEKYQGCIPFIDLNGTDENISFADNAYWTHLDAAGANGFSLGMWVNLPATTLEYLFCKFDNAGAQREWRFIVATTLQLRLADESASILVTRPSAANVATGRWTFLSVTYDGAGGSSAMDSVNLYIDGVLSNGTASNNASYVGMEDKTSPVTIGSLSDGATFAEGKIAGAALSPFHTNKELSAQEVYRLYLLGRAALGLQ